MLNPDEKMLKRVREVVHALNEGHIDVYTFAAVVQRIVEPNLYSSTFAAITARALSKPLPVGQPNTGLQADGLVCTCGDNQKLAMRRVLICENCEKLPAAKA